VRVEIGSYELQHPSYRDYDPNSPVVAARLIRAIETAEGDLRVEHVGSSSIPGCGGKGYIDLLVIYREGELEVAKRALDVLGFQRQPGRDPWPESRPMRVASIEHEGRRYPVHAHVVAESSPEVDAMLTFRDRLRDDALLVRGYEAQKRRLLSEGVSDGEDYAERKSGFVEQVLATRTNEPGREGAV
jgi:GrpB-like predicted nucleotidyltransferase (UPF0157 family)